MFFMKPKLKEFFFGSFPFEESDPNLTKTLILNAFLIITIIVSGLFFIYNIFIASDHLLTSIDMLIFVSMLYALYQLRVKDNYDLASYIGVSALFIAYTAIVMIFHGKDFTMIWTYFFAPFAMVTLSAKKGLIITLFFLIVILTGACYGIGEWQNGLWNMSSYIRFMFAHVVMLYVIYAISNSYEKAYERIKALRYREKAQLKLFEKLSVTDPLTSLYNRRSLKEFFPKEFYDVKRNGGYFAYFLLDLDYFKPYNDTYGHQQGDEVLVTVAKLLQQKTKFAFRIGGDEFAGIIINSKKTMITEAINELQDAVGSLQIENKKSPIGKYITCSVGVHIIEEFEYDFEEIYNLADTALYKAKALGRDQVIYI